MTTQKFYATSVTATGSWTNESNLLGTPNDVFATSGIGSTVRVATDLASVVLPDNHLISVKLGIRCRTTGTGNASFTLAVATQTYSGDKNVGGVPLTAPTTVQDYTITLDQTKFYWVSGQVFQINIGPPGGTAGFGVDAVWFEVEYEAVTATRRYATSVVGTPSNITNPNNALGAPDAAVATHTSTATTIRTLRVALDVNDIDDSAVISYLRFGARVSRSTAAGGVMSFNLYRANATLVASPTIQLLTTLTDYEFDVAGPWTPLEIRTSTVEWNVRGDGTARTSSLDAMWMRPVLAVTASRAKRWTGSAWVDSAVKRWTGSANVDATVKRWNGTAWV